jgi:MCP family monocarboxylic acid transporter-like MFS transporter 10
MAVLYWCWMTNPPASGLIAIAVIFGFASGAFVSLQAPMCTSHATDMRVAGTMVGQVLCEWWYGSD